ncbi:hypothetical protein OG394_27155 [Kribbella sp. NBC_01245]|uniref:hypothetical protein n=1 Tax=Kribbella sp. NBC_01245 TaxID=2903578 RepID=UPI002E2D4275|nr:hypothetical protein [Kribbella sp. NBC_01245]
MSEETKARVNSSAVWALAGVVAIAAAYLALLGWHAEKTLDPATGRETGPYEAWQVIAFVVVLGILAGIMGRAGKALLAIEVLPATVTVLFAIDAATGDNADGLWVVGSLLVLICAAAGVSVVALLAQRK